MSPERLATASLRALLRAARVRVFAIDEAHCISHWDITSVPNSAAPRVARAFPDASIHAFTPTATEQVRSDICAELLLREPLVLVQA